MFKYYHDLKKNQEIFKNELTDEENKNYKKIKQNTKVMVIFNMTYLDWENFFTLKEGKQIKNNCYNKCYDSYKTVNLNEIRLKSFSNCKNECKENFNKYKKKNLDIYFLLLRFYKNKIISCNQKFQGQEEFNDCVWESLNKVRRRLNVYWPKELKDYLN